MATYGVKYMDRDGDVWWLSDHKGQSCWADTLDAAKPFTSYDEANAIADEKREQVGRNVRVITLDRGQS